MLFLLFLTVEFPNYSTESDKFDNTLNDDSPNSSASSNDDLADDDPLLNNKTINDITENSISPLKDIKLYATMTLYPNSAYTLNYNNNYLTLLSSTLRLCLASAIVVIIGYKLY